MQPETKRRAHTTGSRPPPSLALLLLILLAAGLAWPTASAARKTKCAPVRDQEMDRNASRMAFLGDHSFRVPQSVAAMSGFCLQLRDSVDHIQVYSRDCLQGFTRQLLTGLLKRGKQQHAGFCTTTANKQEFMAKMSCLKDEAKMLQFHRVMDASLARFDHIKSAAVKNEVRLPALCCSYQIFFRDLDETLRRLCASQPEANKFVQKLVTGTTGEFLNLICDDHRSLDDCRASAKTRDSLRQLLDVTKRVNAGQLAPQSRSLIPPLLEILDSSN